MNATVNTYNSGTGAFLVTINSFLGLGTYNSWTINLAGASGGNGSSGTSGSTGSSGSSGSSGTSGPTGPTGPTGSFALKGTTPNGIITFDGAPTASVQSNMTFNGSLLTVSASSYFIGSIDQGPFGTINIPSLATDNWYQLGTVSNTPGSGASRLIISYLGNNWAPTTYVIDAFKDNNAHPNTATTLALQKFGTYNYIKEARIVYNNVAAFFSLEGLFEAHGLGHTASVYTQNLLGLSSDWKFRTGTLPVTTLTTDPTNANWISRSTFTVGNGGSTLERLQISDNKYGKYWNLFDAGGASSYQLDIRNATGSVMSFDGDQYKVSIGAPTGPTATDGKLRIFGETNSNVLDLVNSGEPTFKYRIRTLATQANMNPDMNRLGLGIPGAPTQVAFSSGLWHDNVENASIKFWRGGASMDGFLTLNTFGDSTPGTTGTASERLLIRNTGQVVVNPYGYFTASAAILSGKGASASLNVFAINSNNTLNSPYLLALYALDNQWPILTKNPTATDQPDQFFVRHAGSDVHMGNARLGGLLIMTQSNVAVSTNLIVGTHTTPGAKLDVRANAAYGAFRMQDTTQGPGRILVSDADGDGSWTASSAILASANGLTGSGTINYVPYWKSSNNLSATSSLYISNDNVMVGTASAIEKFNVFGNIYAGSTQSTKINIVSGAGVRTYIAAEGGGAGFGSLSNHPVVFYQNDIERARIHTNGYFGIGTQSPGANLEVWNSTDSVVWINSTVNSYLKLKRGSLNADAHISFNTTTAEKHIVGLINNNDILVLGGSEATPVIAVSGSNVGIGTITPTAKLTVQGSFLFGPTTLGTTYFRSWDYGTEFDMSGIGVSGGWARSHRITTVDTSGSIFFGAYGSDATFERTYWTIGTPGATEAGHAFTTGIHLLKNGNVGIGTFAPSSRLHVAHNNTNDLPNLIIGETINTNARSSGIAFKTNWSGQAATSSIVFDYYGSYFTASQGVFSHGLNYVSGRSSFSNHIFRDSSLNIQMIISDSGDVGIGATAPSAKLDINGATGSKVPLSISRANSSTDHMVFVKQDTGAKWWVALTNDDFRVYNSTASANILFGINGSSTDTGNKVGIGTATPNNRLQVVGTASVTNFIMTGGSPASNKVLTSIDGTGAASWTTASTIFTNVSGVTGSGTVNYVPFWNTSSNLSANSPIYIANSNVSIGATRSDAKLVITGGGVGTFSSGSYLPSMIIGSDYQPNYESVEFGSLRTATGSGWTNGGFRIQEKIDSTWMAFMQFNGDGNNNGISFGAGSSTASRQSVPTRMTINSTGNVGIGTTGPSEKLDVNGSIITNDTLRITKGASDTIQLGSSVYLIGNTGSSYTQLQQGVGRFTIWGFNGSEWGEKLTINSTTGNVGIGTASPRAKLDVAGSINILSGLNNASPRPALSAGTLTNGEIRAYSVTASTQDDGFLRISAGGGTNAGSGKTYIDITGYSTVDDMNNNVVIGTRGTERMRIDKDGNVGIGMAPTASTRLVVSGTVSTTNDIVLTSNASYIYTKNSSGNLTRSFGLNGSNNLYIGSVEAAITGILFNNGGVDQMYILANGNVAIGSTYSNARLTVQTPAITGGAGEELARFLVSDDINSYLRIFNSTGTNNSFTPTIEGKHSGGDNGIGIIGNGTTDLAVNTNPITVFDSRLGSAQVVNRPLFQWNNFGSPVMTISATGNLGIGTTTPNYRLQVVGTASVTNFIMTGGSPAINEVLTSFDGNGSATWSTPASVVANASGVTGSGTVNYVPFWKSSNNLAATSSLYVSVDNIGIGTTSPLTPLHIYVTSSLGAAGVDGIRISDNQTLSTAINLGVNTPGTYTWIQSAQGGVGPKNLILNPAGGNVAIGLTQTTYKLDVNGTQRIYGKGLTGSTLFTIQGTTGELFTIVDSLTGSLFSVNDISGLPIIETFSDSTTLIGSYLAPSLYTTKKVVLTAGVTTTIYSIATASYNSAYFDYNAINATNARAGSIMAIWNGANYEFTETTTSDIGNTNGLTFSFSVAAGFANLRALSSAGGWTIKTIIRSI